MKKKIKTRLYFVIGILGIALAIAARFILKDLLSDPQIGAMIGVGAGLFGFGISNGVLVYGAKKS